MRKLPYKRMLVRTLVTEDSEQPLMFIDLTRDTPQVEPFGGIERHSTVFIDGRVALLSPALDLPVEPYLLDD